MPELFTVDGDALRRTRERRSLTPELLSSLARCHTNLIGIRSGRGGKSEAELRHAKKIREARRRKRRHLEGLPRVQVAINGTQEAIRTLENTEV